MFRVNWLLHGNILQFVNIKYLSTIMCFLQLYVLINNWCSSEHGLVATFHDSPQIGEDVFVFHSPLQINATDWSWMYRSYKRLVRFLLKVKANTQRNARMVSGNTSWHHGAERCALWRILQELKEISLHD